MGSLANWRKIGPPLGSGGQSEVWLVRRPDRQLEIQKSISDITDFLVRRGTVDFPDQNEHTLLFAQAIKRLVRDEDPSDLAALKQFKVRDGEQPHLSVARLRREIKVLERGNRGF